MIRRLIILLLIVGCEESGITSNGLTDGTAAVDTLYVFNYDTLIITNYDTTFVYDTLIVLDTLIIEMDCNGVQGGTAQLDNCGVCDTDLSNDCVQDCAGVWGGLCEECDCAGVCRGFSVLSGCDNVCNSTAVYDCTGVCGGSAVDDCTGVCGGSAVDDCTGVCGGSLLNICIGFDTNIQDSCLVYDGFWSELGFDACGVCGGDNSSCNDECPDITTTSSDCSAPWSQSCHSQCNDHCSLQIDYEGNPCIVVGMGTDCIDHECYCNCEPNSGGLLDP